MIRKNSKWRGVAMLATALGVAFMAAPAMGEDNPPAGAAANVSDQPAKDAGGAPPAAEAPKAINVKGMFASNCSWCHDDYGMQPGKGPRLAGTAMTKEQVYERISNGKSGQMPAFKKVLSEEQIQAFANYIKGLKPPAE